MRHWLAAAPAFLLCANAFAAAPATPVERLGIADLVEAEHLTGKGTRIAIFSEAVDADHPLLARTDLEQYRILLDDSGEPGVPARADPDLVMSEWHGTHVAGIVGADCDAGEQRGVACGAAIRVHDFGVYGDFPWHLEPVSEALDPETAFFRRLTAAVRSEAGSDIANLSFNIEAPYIPLADEGGEARPIAELLGRLGVPFEQLFGRLRDLLAERRIELADSADADVLGWMGGEHDDPPALVYGLLVPHSTEWRELAGSIAAFQAGGAVVVISESNNRFGERSGVLNALPAIAPGVSRAGWLSVVHVEPDGMGGWRAPLNACGALAQDFCLAVPAGAILAPAAAQQGVRAQSGHSMAAPMVSGVLSLMIELGRRSDPDFSAADALAILRRTAKRDFRGYAPVVHGVGVIDAGAALSMLEETR